MAADILLYQTDKVPIGDDQRQHLELTRNLAERFNSRYGETFKLPEGIYPEVGARVMDLQEPDRKMSTTGGTPQGTIGLLDPPDTVRRKVRSAVTDSGNEVRRSEDKPGITNLIDMMAVATGSTPKEIEARFDGTGYGRFKEEVAEAVVALLDPIRLRYGELRANQAVLRAILAEGAAKAELIAAATLEVAYERVGFVAP
jgi:tryptophanyl-tRNA synthetase